MLEQLKAPDKAHGVSRYCLRRLQDGLPLSSVYSAFIAATFLNLSGAP